MNIVIKQPIITEKTLRLAETNNQYTFEVSMDADKVTARKQIEDLYKVSVTGVTSIVRLGKGLNVGRGRSHQARRRHRKVMVFTLEAKNKIDIFTQQ